MSQFTPAGTCAVLPNAQVDIWHCDAMGAYSGVEDRYGSTAGKMFLRGYQVSDTEGMVRFTTIYPGWYPGRARSIFTSSCASRRPAAGRTSSRHQLYFSDELTDRVHAEEPYSAHRGQRLVNARDMIFREGGGQLVLPVVEDAGAYAATFKIAMQPGQSREAAPGRGPRRRW